MVDTKNRGFLLKKNTNNLSDNQFVHVVVNQIRITYTYNVNSFLEKKNHITIQLLGLVF